MLFSFILNHEFQPQKKEPSEEFKKYWYGGKAELSSYKLEQARYGELRKGKAILIFVKIDADKNELTKIGEGKTNGIPTLQINFEKKFVTGIYPYSMLLSALTPIDSDLNPHSLKVSGSCQEWCGHTYTQLNLKGNKYEMSEHSYFPGEGDREKKFPIVWLEDEVWTKIRIAPEQLPVGKINMVSGIFYGRFSHQELKIHEVEVIHSDFSANPEMKEYKIIYNSGERLLAIRYEKKFPHVIDSWEETYKDGFGPRSTLLTTKASRIKTIQLDYWTKNSVGDSVWRKELELTDY